ncbi:MAG: DUF4832 domain-containing protein [Nitrospira sp. NTP1]|nr:DUF4832 domain-containing protein [Nitrospira sp. NTP1]
MKGASMQGAGWKQALLIMMGLSVAACVSPLSGEPDRAVATSTGTVVTVHPREIDDVLDNPGMGFADFHFGFGHPPKADEYPHTTVAYFRWPWAELEPAEGQYNFALVDGIIAQAKAKGETLAIRIVSEYKTGTPQWLLDKGVGSVKESDGIFPDYNNPIFLDYHERLIRAFGDRYGRSLDIDHVDIGSVGCWGEWNTACCGGVEAQCKAYFPTEANQLAITDWYLTYFAGTPLVMLHGGQLKYATSRGAGWRADCFGDYGYFSPDWNHMEHAYAPVLEEPAVADAWKRGPVQMEVCGYIHEWHERGFDLDRILEKGLEWHVSVLNAKSKPVPAAWRPRFTEFLKKIGYRFVLRELTHPATSGAGESFVIQSRWDNKGVAPIYHAWPLAYRLRSGTDRVVAQWVSSADLKQWLPGPSRAEDRVVVPAGVPAGSYTLDVAILAEDARSAVVELAIEGKRADRWYAVSQLEIR